MLQLSIGQIDSILEQMDYTKFVVHLVTLFNNEFFNIIGKPEAEKRQFHHKWMQLVFKDFNEVATPVEKQSDLSFEEMSERFLKVGDKNTTVLQQLQQSKFQPALQLVL